MSISESDATRWKPLPVTPIYSPDRPSGLLLLLTTLPHRHTPPEPPVSLILTSYITHLFHSDNQIKDFCVEHLVQFDSVVHLCNKIRSSLFLPLLIRRTLRLIWRSVSRPHSWALKANVIVCFIFSDLHWHAPTVWNRATPLTLSSASHCPFLFARPGEHCSHLSSEILIITIINKWMYLF